MTRRSLGVALAASLLCSSCMIGPKYQRPVAQTPPALKELAGNDQWQMATPSDDLLKGNWWEMFGDAELNRLEEMVSVNNQNIKQAEAQYRQARAIVNLNHANYYPVIGSTPSISQTDAGTNAVRGGGNSQTFSLGAAASWEPDFWGRVRTAVEGSTASAQASAALVENVRLAQQTLLATDYFAIAANEMQQDVLKQSIEAYEKNVQLASDRFKFGVASRSDIALAQAQLAGAQAQRTDLSVAHAQLEHAIATITGQPASALTITANRIAGPPPPIPVALPSRLLERRPDIASAERQVAAANANIGLAQAAFYPTLTLSASVGFLTTDLANLFTFASRSWSAGPSITQTLFDFGRRGATMQNVEAAYDATAASYRQTVLAAFQEVEDDLSSLHYLAQEAVVQDQAVKASQESLSLELDRYKAGTDSYVNVITTQNIALGNQLTAIGILQRRVVAAVDLVKAVGGGWDSSTLPSTDALRAVNANTPKPPAYPVGTPSNPLKPVRDAK